MRGGRGVEERTRGEEEERKKKSGGRGEERRTTGQEASNQPLTLGWFPSLLSWSLGSGG